MDNNKTMLPPVILGSGLAGLSVALAMAPRDVIVLTSRTIGQESSSILAQGGIAAALGSDDSAELHAQDTMVAGAGLCDPGVVRMVTEAAPDAIQQLMNWGVAFDRDGKGDIDLCLEGGHSRRRIVHADGDSTGSTVTRTLAAKALKTPSLTIIDNARATAITTDGNTVSGVTYVRDGAIHHVATDNVVLATGGIGALWPHTTNPHGSWGQGLLLAARAGAALRDLEFVQFHPTGIDVGLDPMPLASESLRGEGARLINDRGEHFMEGTPRGELAPRDIVARAIWAQLQKGRRVFLDTRMIPVFSKRFPTIYDFCMKAGLDPARELIPVHPTAHYHMGGVAVDVDGRTSVSGLWACGEVAATGLHGANRLASNSLLEAVVCGLRVAARITPIEAKMVPANKAEKLKFAPSPSPPSWKERRWGEVGSPPSQTSHRLCGKTHLTLNPSPPKREERDFTPRLLHNGGTLSSDASLSSRISEIHKSTSVIRAIMATHVGVLRDKVGLEKAVELLTPLAAQSDMAVVGLMIATAALHRQESRGAHCRTDFPYSTAASAHLCASRELSFLHRMGKLSELPFQKMAD